MNTQFDVIIAGGGAAGYSLSMALHTARPTLKIAIIEASDISHAPSQNAFDARAIALSAQSFDFLSTIGLKEPIGKIATPIKTIHVSDKGHLGTCSLSHGDYHLPALGYVVSLQEFGQTLQKYLSNNCSFFQPDKIVGLSQRADDVSIELQSGSTLTSRLLVVAEGQFSSTREILGFAATSQDYKQTAVVTNVRLEANHRNVAYERFTQFGPLAMLPVAEDIMSLVWCTYSAQAKQLLDMPEAKFIASLQDAFGYRTGKITDVAARHSYPLQLVQSDEIIQHRVALVGNSAQALHPIAGQGFNLGLRDIQRLAAVTKQYTDPGCYGALRDYRKSRLGDRDHTVLMTDALVKLFSNQDVAKLVGRNMGLIAMDLITPLKEVFARFAMGQLRD